MTVSLHDSWLFAVIRRGTFAVVAACLLLPAALAQDAADEAAMAAEAKAAAEAQALAKPKPPRSLYYLGERPSFKRQEGPPIGAPLSITPQPYVPRGSITPPDTPPAEPVEDALTVGAASGAMQAEDGASNDVPSTIESLPEDAPTEADLPNAEEAFLQAGSLSELDASGLNVLPAPEAFPRTFWQGYSRAEIMAAYGQFANTGNSPLLKNIARRIALSGTALAPATHHGETLAFLSARLDLLASLGDVAGYQALLDRLPEGQDWSGLARHFSNSHLRAGRIRDVCALAADQRASDSDPYWIRIAAFCHATNANRAGVDFELEILDELTDVQPAFFQLVDRILVEAEKPAGSLITAAGALSNPLRVDLLEVAMARLSRSGVPVLTLDSMNPLAVNGMLALPGLSAEAETALIGESLKTGALVNTDMLVAFALSLELSTNERAATFMPSDSEEGFAREMRLLHLAAKAPYETDRYLAVRQVWDRAATSDMLPSLASPLLQLTADLPKTVGTDYPMGILARAFLLAGRMQEAKALYGAMRASAAGATEAADRQLINLMPVMLIAGVQHDTANVTRFFDLWMQQQADNPNRLERANLLFSLAEAVGMTVPEASWEALAAMPVGTSESLTQSHTVRHTVNTALWRSFLKAAERGDGPAVLVKMFSLMEQGHTAISPAVAGSLVATLKAGNMETEARALALEIAIAQGL